MREVKIFILSCVLLITKLANAQYEGDSCTLAHNGQPGTCKTSRQCPEVIALYRQGQKFTTCSFSSGNHIVCCPTNSNLEPRPLSAGKRISAQKCDDYKKFVKKKSFIGGLTLTPVINELAADDCETTTGLIVGGEVTKTGEFPHMAALGYRSLVEVIFFCGGSLISDQFVLTAAHCKRFLDKSPFARLGDQNIKSSTSDGITGTDISISEIIRHEQYDADTKQNDIALAKLASRVKFTKLIRPACLWQTHAIDTNKTVATGWGNTHWTSSTSDELRKVQLDILTSGPCERLLVDEDFKFTDKQICAGVLAGGKDTCNGDSGGPIQITLAENRCIRHIIGVTSFGAYCGGANVPAFYTRVSSYLDWIEAKVWN